MSRKVGACRRKENIEGINKEKYKQVLLYICSKVGGLPHIGKTVLFKLLYFVDFDHYELYEKSITGDSYYKIELGPAPSYFNLVVEELVQEKRIKRIRVPYYYHLQEKFIALAEADLRHLSSNEVKVIDDVLDRLSQMNATQIVEYSHHDIPWEVTKEGRIINYELVFYRKPEYSVKEYRDDLPTRPRVRK